MSWAKELDSCQNEKYSSHYRVGGLGLSGLWFVPPSTWPTAVSDPACHDLQRCPLRTASVTPAWCRPAHDACHNNASPAQPADERSRL